MGVSHCKGIVCERCNTGDADNGCSPLSVFQIRQNQQQTLQMLLIALDAFEENCSQEEQGPVVITAEQRRAVDAALDSWMACLPRQKGVPLAVDGADCMVSLRLNDPAELILRARDTAPGEEGEEHLDLARLTGIEVGTRQIPPVFGPGAEGCCTSPPAECVLLLSNADSTVRKLRVECDDPLGAASFGLTLRILQSIGPGALSAVPVNQPGDDKKGSKKHPKPGKLKLEHLTGLAHSELSARLSSRSGTSARGGKNSARGPLSKISQSGDPQAPDSARSAPVQGVSSSYSTRISNGKKSSKQHKASSKKHSVSAAVPVCREDGPEAAAGSPPDFLKKRSLLEIPHDASATPSGNFHGSLLPKWYHQAMDDDPGPGGTTWPSSDIDPVVPAEPPGVQEVRAFLNDCGLVKHVDALLRCGFDSMEALQHAEDEHLEKVGLPLGHRLLLMRKLKVTEDVNPNPKGKRCVLDDQRALRHQDSKDDEPTSVFDSIEMERFRQRRNMTMDRSFSPGPESP